MATDYTDITTVHIDFTDDTWLNAFPNIYNFINTSSIPWYINNTFPYNEQNSLRSGVIGHNGSTTITLEFVLIEDGSITFPYCITSESGCDFLTVNIDGEQVVRVAGSYNWTVYTKQLKAGEHTTTFTYSKDGSVSIDADAAAIGEIELLGVEPNYNKYYLVHDLETNKYYANIEGTLTETALMENPTLQHFINFGGAIPTANMLETFTKFELLKCVDTIRKPEKIPGMTVQITGNAKPELFKCIPAINITEQYQTGFKSISCECTKLDSTELVFIISYDNIQWYAYNTELSAWVSVEFNTQDVLDKGMSLETLELVTEDVFAILYTEDVPKIMYIAFAIRCSTLDDWCINNIKIAYTTTK